MTGTRNVARFFGRDAEVAAVGVGKIAGLVLLDANPLTDAANVRAADGHLDARAMASARGTARHNPGDAVNIRQSRRAFLCG